MPQQPNYTTNQPENAIVSQETIMLRERIVAFCEAVVEVRVTSDEEYIGAGEITKILSAHKAELESRRSDEVRPHLDRQRQINDWCKPVLAQLDGLQRKVGQAIYVYRQEQERKRREEQRRIEEEKRRREAEERAAAEKARREAEEARAAGDEQSADDLDAQAMELDFSASLPAPVAAPAAPKLDGVHIRHNWTAEITNEQAFVRHCVDNKLYDFLSGDVRKLRAEAKKIQREQTYPGARIFDNPSTVSKRGSY